MGAAKACHSQLALRRMRQGPASKKYHRGIQNLAFDA